MLPVEINKHQCNLCEYKTSKKQTLGAHVRGVHEGVNFECDQCDYKAFFRSSNLCQIYDNSDNCNCCDICNDQKCN